MSARIVGIRQSRSLICRTEVDASALLEFLPQIRRLVDTEKDALGFLPEAAYREAIEKRRMIAMCAPIDGQTELIGFVLFSGVFPNARIQQLVVQSRHRRAGIATALVNVLVSQLEARGYLTLVAAVASDLSAAQAFYERNKFIARRSVPGGQSRNRRIILRARDLETESLFTILEPLRPLDAVDLGLRIRSASQAPLYVIDLNVIFDLIKDKSRPRSPGAGKLIAAALAHKIRLAIAPEFIVELERQKVGENDDPILKLARQLPRLAPFEEAETERLADQVFSIVFSASVSRSWRKPQALSDARHLAQAALARASCYVTSDGQLLEARDALLEQIGIDVASLDEFAELLPADSVTESSSQLQGTECVTGTASAETIRNYLERQEVSRTLIEEFAVHTSHLTHWSGRAVSEAGEVVAVGIHASHESIDAPARALVHVRPDHVNCEIFAEHLIDVQCHEAGRSGPITIELPDIPGQSVVRRAATFAGFLPVPKADTMIKVALGCPVTEKNWSAIARQTRRRTGLRLPVAPLNLVAVSSGLLVHGPDGKSARVRLPALENALAPTILVWPGRDGVIVPIAKNYADDLLGTGDQFPLFGSPQAAFVTRRTYFNSPRASTLMRPGVPVLFYESKRSGGRGAIVAAGRIVDVTIMAKQQVPDDLLRRAVVEDLDPLSTSPEVLATTFDNLLRFPVPVSLNVLRSLGATGSNLQTATAIASVVLGLILERGWARV